MSTERKLQNNEVRMLSMARVTLGAPCIHNMNDACIINRPRGNCAYAYNGMNPACFAFALLRESLPHTKCGTKTPKAQIS